MQRLYLIKPFGAQIEGALMAGQIRCCNAAHHGKHTRKIISFDRNPAALDALLRRGWCVCGECYKRYLANGQKFNTDITFIDFDDFLDDED